MTPSLSAYIAGNNHFVTHFEAICTLSRAEQQTRISYEMYLYL
jgi:hypothetical protein